MNIDDSPVKDMCTHQSPSLLYLRVESRLERRCGETWPDQGWTEQIITSLSLVMNIMTRRPGQLNTELDSWAHCDWSWSQAKRWPRDMMVLCHLNITTTGNTISDTIEIFQVKLNNMKSVTYQYILYILTLFQVIAWVRYLLSHLLFIWFLNFM